MPDLAPASDLLGERLRLDEYNDDFGERQWMITGGQSWKLERQQHFIEPGFPS